MKKVTTYMCDPDLNRHCNKKHCAYRDDLGTCAQTIQPACEAKGFWRRRKLKRMLKEIHGSVRASMMVS